MHKRFFSKIGFRWAAGLLSICLLLSVIPLQAIAADSPDEYEIAYHLIKNLKNDQSTASFPSSASPDTRLLCDLINMVYPYQFSLKHVKYSANEEIVKTTFELTPVDQPEWISAAQSRAKEVVSQTITPDMTDRQKAQILHDWLVNNCRYNHTAVNTDDVLPFTAYSALVAGSTVCSGYTNAYTLLLREAGVPVVRINGLGLQGNGTSENHTWNMLLVDGAWRFVDVTWDDADRGSPLYTYFLITLEKIARDHQTNIAPYHRFLQYVMPERNDYADALALRNLFRGMTNGAYNLDSIPDRAQGAVMMARLLGLDEEAAYLSDIPFTDVPPWAESHVNFLYAQGLTNGTSATLFSPSTKIKVNEYLTFVLRAMGYKDGVDFTWDRATVLGLKLGLVTSDQLAALSVRPFLRADMVNITYAALSATCANGQTLDTQLAHTLRKAA